MEDIIFKLIERELEMYRNLQSQYIERIEELDEYSGMFLKANKKKGHNYYYAHQTGEPYRYLGGEGNSDVRNIKELRICDELHRRLQTNVQLMAYFLENYEPVELTEVMKALPKQYQLPSFEEEQGDAIHQRYVEMMEYKKTVPVSHPENLKITAFDGTQVRSRAEAMIYERLRAAGFYVIYEYPIEYEKGRHMFPDYLLIHPLTGQIFIIEHLGRWFYQEGKNEYRNSFLWKTDVFRQIGFIQGVNLYVTIEENSYLDLEKLKKDLAYLFNTAPTSYTKELEKRQQNAFRDPVLFRN